MCVTCEQRGWGMLHHQRVCGVWCVDVTYVRCVKGMWANWSSRVNLCFNIESWPVTFTDMVLA